MTDELQRSCFVVGERRVWRPCREQGLWSTTTKNGRTGKRPGPAVHEDLVNGEFTADAPNRIWLTDIAEHPTGEGKVYCCAIKDVFSNRIVGYAIEDRMTAQLADAALRAAVDRAAPSWSTATAGRNSAIDTSGQCSTRTGSPDRWDADASGDVNDAIESFFALLQKNVLNRRRWRTRNELRYEIIYWIEHIYNRGRRRGRLSRLTPIEYEPAFTSAGDQATRSTVSATVNKPATDPTHHETPSTF